MPRSGEHNGAEARKLKAMSSIAAAVTDLGKSLGAVAAVSADNARLLQTIDGKLDRLTQMMERSTAR